jgi:hypothetical protein
MVGENSCYTPQNGQKWLGRIAAILPKMDKNGWGEEELYSPKWSKMVGENSCYTPQNGLNLVKSYTIKSIAGGI